MKTKYLPNVVQGKKFHEGIGEIKTDQVYIVARADTSNGYLKVKDVTFGCVVNRHGKLVIQLNTPILVQNHKNAMIYNLTELSVNEELLLFNITSILENNKTDTDSIIREIKRTDIPHMSYGRINQSDEEYAEFHFGTEYEPDDIDVCIDTANLFASFKFNTIPFVDYYSETYPCMVDRRPLVDRLGDEHEEVTATIVYVMVSGSKMIVLLKNNSTYTLIKSKNLDIISTFCVCAIGDSVSFTNNEDVESTTYNNPDEAWRDMLDETVKMVRFSEMKKRKEMVNKYEN